MIPDQNLLELLRLLDCELAVIYIHVRALERDIAVNTRHLCLQVLVRTLERHIQIAGRQREPAAGGFGD